MVNYFKGKQIEDYVSYTRIWPKKSKIGRYYKRMLSKARRRYWKDSHKRGLAHIESIVNYKGY